MLSHTLTLSPTHKYPHTNTRTHAVGAEGVVQGNRLLETNTHTHTHTQSHARARELYLCLSVSLFLIHTRSHTYTYTTQTLSCTHIHALYLSHIQIRHLWERKR